jgi:hypothetical protein
MLFKIFCRRLSKGVDYLVEASAAEAEAISATLAAVRARQVNGEMEQLPDKESPDSTSSSKHSSLIKPESAVPNNMSAPPGVRLHHRAVSRIRITFCFSLCIFISFENLFLGVRLLLLLAYY